MIDSPGSDPSKLGKAVPGSAFRSTFYKYVALCDYHRKQLSCISDLDVRVAYMVARHVLCGWVQILGDQVNPATPSRTHPER